MSLDINKEFSDWFVAQERVPVAAEAYIAAAAPRDLLIAQLVKALKEAQEHMRESGQGETESCAPALSAAKERGYS